MEESILRMHDKTTLKNMAFNRGLSRRGHNGRNASRMRKQDFIDFIMVQNHRDQSAVLGSDFLGDDMIRIFQEFIMDETFTFNPFIHLMGTIKNSTSKSPVSNQPSPEEDEPIPDLTLKPLEPCTKCECTTCMKNSIKQEENLKVHQNILNLESKIMCVVCQANVRNVVFVPCNHLATCISCSANPLMPKKCPMCRKGCKTTIKIFF
ncbi:hypothetical protein MIV021L [Invertebrate iridescent virus 3]|uniref:Putative apoptosis inhibitor 021L n=1 Tax=Invertebrate iridescent virus 3 TaxID=345201 RepID=VF193_IIV3|nr:hypothetical protein MIV021L [Invertebrate iridescent virus 3]Q197D9.1 RecName: Full=Putative apoptosis inhibitor 021L [Invertebrate iridescent virus 3]ABF82051.1 hypothetical protein MIV021L [Invertebrate iridescent virus 3]